MNDMFRYRVITNLQCNKRCKFCYQTYKPDINSDIVLSLQNMENTMLKVFNSRGMLKRATIMGGESLLLSNICDYVKISKKYASVLCLVTNGTLLTRDVIDNLSQSGIDEVAISISDISSLRSMMDVLVYARDNVPNMRVNIPRCDESSGDKLKKIVFDCLNNDFGCVVCEDLMGRYGIPHVDEISGWEDVYMIDNSYNFITYEHIPTCKKFGLFAHYSGYNNTDIIITPLGNFCDWSKYCKKIGNHDLC